MPAIYLRDYEVEEQLLPNVCMRCGARATTEKAKSFAWHPPWLALTLLLGLIPGAIILLVMTKNMRVYVPLCDQHRNHWGIRTAISLIGGLVIIVGTIGAMILLDEPGSRDLMGWTCLTGGILMVLWLIAVVAIQYTAIRPTEITDRGITLAGVCPEFLDALDAYREEGRGRRRRPREEYRDEEPRPPRRPRPVDDDRIRGTDRDEDERVRD